MERTLYLDEKAGVEVLRDGPSIYVKEPNLAGRRIPARLIEHVVIIGNVKFEAGVITLFTENNIPITFMNKKGEEVALAIPFNHNNNHYHDQRKILEREKSIEYYRQWLESERRTMQLKVIKKLSKQVASVFIKHGFKEQDYQVFINRSIGMGNKKKKIIIKDIISNLMKEMILKSIISSNLDPHIGVINRRENFGLVLDIYYALEPESDLQAIQFLRSSEKKDYIYMSSTGLTVSKEGMRNILNRFENKKKIFNDFIEHILDGLFETMRNVKIMR